MFDLVSAEITRIAMRGFDEVMTRTSQPGTDVLLRRFSNNYDKMTIEDIEGISAAMGHEDGETKPCKVCTIMARKEFALAED